MQLTIEHIEQDLVGGQPSPGRLADYRLYLAAMFSITAAQLQEIESIKPRIWLSIRERKNSDKAADREWQASELGQDENKLNWQRKRIDKLSSAINTKINIMRDEMRNIA